MLNIRTRLTFQFASLVTLILLFFSLGVYFFSSLYLEKRFYKRLQDRAITTTTLLFDLQQTDSTVLRLIGAADKEPLLNEAISVYNEKTGEVLFATNLAGSQFHRQFIPKLDSSAQTVLLRQGDYQVAAIHLTRGGGGNWVIVSGINQAGADALADLRKILLVMLLAAVLLLGLSGWFFADRALAPMSGIIGQVNAIFPSNLSRRVAHANATDEIGQLVGTFNRLLDRIEQALTAQKMFIANISHELKNPLTKINAQIDVALLQPRSQPVYEQTLRSLQEDTRALSQLTTTLLELANTAVLAENMAFEPVRMDELLWEAKQQVESWQEGYQVRLAFPDFPDDEEALLVRGHRAALRVLLTNLLDNACKFSPNNEAQVTFRAGGGQIGIAVTNEGMPIPDADLPHLFEPFFRGNATAQSSRGYGVGLAVAKQVTDLHGGSITAQSTARGTTFMFTLGSMKNLLTGPPVRRGPSTGSG